MRVSGRPTRPLRELLELDIHQVDIVATDTYPLAGVFGFGRGLFSRGSITGSDTSYPKLNRLTASQLVVSRLKAFEGAVAIVPDEFDGWFLSPEFPTFRCIEDELDPTYMAHICRWPEFWAMLAASSKGIGARRERVHSDQLLRLKLQVPSVDEQRSVATRLDEVRGRISATLYAQKSAEHLDKALIDASIGQTIEQGIESGWPTAPLGQVAEINPRGDRLASDEFVSFVPMAAVSKWTGSIEKPELRTAAAIGTGFKQFKRGDLIFARITPCMQNGKTAIFDGATTYGYGSTEFHVIRPGPLVEARWLHRFLRTQELRNAAALRFTGTAGQQRVPAEFLRTVRIPIPPKQAEVVAAMDRLLQAGASIRARRTKASELLGAIEPSMLNQALSGLT
jgi:type I restriction enzyme S subunit